jgi:hypothetical protein
MTHSQLGRSWCGPRRARQALGRDRKVRSVGSELSPLTATSDRADRRSARLLTLRNGAVSRVTCPCTSPSQALARGKARQTLAWPLEGGGPGC